MCWLYSWGTSAKLSTVSTCLSGPGRFWQKHGGDGGRLGNPAFIWEQIGNIGQSNAFHWFWGKHGNIIGTDWTNWKLHQPKFSRPIVRRKHHRTRLFRMSGSAGQLVRSFCILSSLPVWDTLIALRQIQLLQGGFPHKLVCNPPWTKKIFDHQKDPQLLES